MFIELFIIFLGKHIFFKSFQKYLDSKFLKDAKFRDTKTCVQADFEKRSFFVKPKWFHGGFKLSHPETTSDLRWFQALLEVFFFFLVNVSIPKKDPKWAKIHHMSGFNLYSNFTNFLSIYF